MDDELDNPGSGIGIEDAAKAFETLLGGDEPNPKPVKKPQREPVAAEEEDTEGSDEDETADDVEGEDAEDDDGAEEDPEADAEDEEGDDFDPDLMVTVKVDGKAEKIPLKEAIAGYQRQADYSRKTGQLAEERRSFQAEVQAVQQERAQYAELLGQLETQMSSVPEPNWDELKRVDPVGWAIARQEWAERQQGIQAVREERARAQVMMQETQAQAMRQLVTQEMEALLTAKPEWRDPKVFQKVKTDLREYGKTIGFSDDELAGVTDHRALLALHKAMMFDRVANRKERPVKKQASPTIAKPAAVTQVPRRTSDLTKAKQRLAKSGKVSDAAAVFEKLL
jgi:hypothetical protein